MHFRSQPKIATPLTEKDTVVLADFTNNTGDPVFDETLKQALAAQLEQSPFLNILSDRRITETLQLMGRNPKERITVDMAREICIRTGTKAMLAGSVSKIGTQYLVGLQATSCANGDDLAKEQVEATNKEDVVKALDKAATSLRAKLGESLASVQKFDVPIEATTPSLEALKTFSMGVTTLREKGEAEAIPFFRRSIELDPNFAVAYASMGMAYGNLGQSGLAAKNIERAYELRDHVSEREKYRISALYYQNVTGELEKAQTYELWAQSYPHDMVPHSNLGHTTVSSASTKNPSMNQVRPSLLSRTPQSLWEPAAFMVEIRFDDAKATLAKARARNLDGGWLRQVMYLDAFLNNDPREWKTCHLGRRQARRRRFCSPPSPIPRATMAVSRQPATFRAAPSTPHAGRLQGNRCALARQFRRSARPSSATSTSRVMTAAPPSHLRPGAM